MAIDSLLPREIVDFISSRIPGFQNVQGRKALLLTSGLDELLPRIDLSGSTYTFVSLLIGQLYRYGTLSNGQNALEYFLQEMEGEVGIDGQEKLRSFRERLQADAKETSKANSSEALRSGISARTAKRKIQENEELLEILRDKRQFLRTDLLMQVDPKQRFSTERSIKEIEDQIEKLEEENESLRGALQNVV